MHPPRCGGFEATTADAALDRRARLRGEGKKPSLGRHLRPSAWPARSAPWSPFSRSSTPLSAATLASSAASAAALTTTTTATSAAAATTTTLAPPAPPRFPGGPFYAAASAGLATQNNPQFEQASKPGSVARDRYSTPGLDVGSGLVAEPVRPGPFGNSASSGAFYPDLVQDTPPDAVSGSPADQDDPNQYNQVLSYLLTLTQRLARVASRTLEQPRRTPAEVSSGQSSLQASVRPLSTLPAASASPSASSSLFAATASVLVGHGRSAAQDAQVKWDAQGRTIALERAAQRAGPRHVQRDRLFTELRGQSYTSFSSVRFFDSIHQCVFPISIFLTRSLALFYLSFFFPIPARKFAAEQVPQGVYNRMNRSFSRQLGVISKLQKYFEAGNLLETDRLLLSLHPNLRAEAESLVDWMSPNRGEDPMEEMEAPPVPRPLSERGPRPRTDLRDAFLLPGGMEVLINWMKKPKKSGASASWAITSFCQ
jgi:hypothetical protein